MNQNRNYRKDGTVIHCEWYNSSRRDKSGKLISILSFVLDITEREKAAEALRQSEGLFRAVTDNSRDAIYVKDCQSRWLLANPALLRIVGKASRDVLGWSDAEIYADPAIGKAIVKNDRRIMERGEPEAFRKMHRRPQECVYSSPQKRLVVMEKGGRSDWSASRGTSPNASGPKNNCASKLLHCRPPPTRS